MFDSSPFDSARRALILSLAAVALAACGGNSSTKTTAATSANGSTSEYLLEKDHITGSPDAPVTLVEYASVACGACANWHNSVYPDLKKKYIDTCTLCQSRELLQEHCLPIQTPISNFQNGVRR